MTKLHSRIATIQDLDALFKISVETFTSSFAHLNDPEDFKAYIEKHKSKETLEIELSGKESTFILFTTEEGQLCAYCKLNVGEGQSDIQDPTSLEIERIYVYDNFQGQGIGVHMLSVCEEIAKSKGLTYIWLGVWEKNLGAIRFYEREGFVAFSTHPFLIGSDVQTDILMKKIIA